MLPDPAQALDQAGFLRADHRHELVVMGAAAALLACQQQRERTRVSFELPPQARGAVDEAEALAAGDRVAQQVPTASIARWPLKPRPSDQKIDFRGPARNSSRPRFEPPGLSKVEALAGGRIETDPRPFTPIASKPPYARRYWRIVAEIRKLEASLLGAQPEEILKESRQRRRATSGSL